MKQALNEVRIALTALVLVATPSFGFWVAGGIVPDVGGRPPIRQVRGTQRAEIAMPASFSKRYGSGTSAAHQLRVAEEDALRTRSFLSRGNIAPKQLQ